MIDLQTISIGLAALSFILAVTYYTFNMRHARETRQAQLFMQLASEIFSKEMLQDGIELLEMEWDDLKDFYSKYDSSVDMSNFTIRFHYWFMMDQVGYLLKRGLIDRKLTYALMSGMQGPMQWQKFEPIIKHQREYQNLPEFGVWFEYLNNEVTKMLEQKGHSTTWRGDPSIYPEKL